MPPVDEQIEQPSAPQPLPATFEEYEASRATKPASEVAKAAEPSSDATETPEGSTEQAAKPKRDRTAEGRIAELTAQLKAEREELARMRETRQAQDAANQPKPAEAVKAETKPESAAGKPLLKDFVAQLKGDETYEDAQERWNDAVLDWREKQSNAKAAEAETTRQTEAQRQKFAQHVAAKTEEGKAKYEDFDATLNTPWAPQALQPAIIEYMADCDSMDALYFLAKNPDEATRIAGLSKTRQLAELGKIEDRLATKPEAKTPPVSKAPAPIRAMSGSAPEADDDPLKATSFDEFAKRRAKQQKK